ncbi:MAG: glycoside hydrolase family 2 protein, partial [Bacteroidales bacterium]
ASGDSHYWGVWYGQQPFEILDTNVPRFMSEFGFQSFPEMKTIATFAGPEDLEIESTVMNKHQKSSIGNHLIKTYMERDYIVPAKFEDFVYVGLVLQGQGMRHGFEAHRRNRPYCEGTLYWQFNDSWPVVSWAGVDYWGNWKALHYQAQRAFEPILINAIEEKGQFNVYL